MDNTSRIESIKELLADEPNDIFLNYSLGMEYKSLSDFDKALIQFRRALELDETYLGAYYQIGEILIEQEKENDAIHIIEQGIEQAKQKKDFKTHRELQALMNAI